LIWKAPNIYNNVPDFLLKMKEQYDVCLGFKKSKKHTIEFYSRLHASEISDQEPMDNFLNWLKSEMNTLANKTESSTL